VKLNQNFSTCKVHDCDLPCERHRCGLLLRCFRHRVPRERVERAYTRRLERCKSSMCVSKKPLRKDACWAVLGLIKSACVHNVWPVIAERDRRACAHLRLTLRSHLKYCTQILGVTCREERLDHPFVAGIPCFFTGGQPWPVPNCVLGQIDQVDSPNLRFGG
jgi:hypothetical protein